MRLSGSLKSKDFQANDCFCNWLPVDWIGSKSPFTCRASSMFGQEPDVVDVLVFPANQRGWNCFLTKKKAASRTSFRWSEPLLFLDLCRKFHPSFHLPTSDTPQKEPRLAARGCKVSGIKSGAEIRRYFVAIVSQNCTSVETCGAGRTSFGALMHQMQFWNSWMLLEEGYLLLQSITILPSSPVSALIAPVCVHSEACLVNIHCFPFKCLIICMGNTETHCDGRVLCIKCWGGNSSCVSQPKRWEWSSLRLYSH